MQQVKYDPTEELARIPDNGKAEIVDGVTVLRSPTGFLPHHAGGEIYASLREYARGTRTGYAIADNAGFIVDLPHRQSFSPDAAFYAGKPTGMRFIQGAPVFAVEVRSVNDYGPAAEQSISEKRADYFSAGSHVVWDVDLLSEDIVRVYRADSPAQPAIYRRGDLAEAEQAVPDWSIPVDDLFPYYAVEQ